LIREVRTLALRAAAAACMLAVMVVVMVSARGDALARAEDLFDGEVLQRLDLRLDPRTWDTLKANFREDDYYPATLEWSGHAVRNVGIRSRGGGSRNGTKIGMRVDFGRFSASQTFLGLRSIVLDNLGQDASGVKERVAMRLYERLGLVVPREAHARLYVNGQYLGLYAVVESVDEDFARRAFGEPGYLFEYEYDTEWFLSYPGPELEKYRELFDPVTHRRSRLDALYGPLHELLRVVNESPDEEFQPLVGRYLDLPLFMRHVAAQNFAAQLDGILGYAGVNNFYVYRAERSPRSQFVAWDEDNAFFAPDYPILQGHERNVLMRRAMAVPELRALYFDSLLAAADAAEGWLEEEIRRQRAMIREALQADDLKPFTNEQVADAEARLLEFARSRPAIVRRAVANLRN
jgi:spore coat protein CotH